MTIKISFSLFIIITFVSEKVFLMAFTIRTQASLLHLWSRNTGVGKIRLSLLIYMLRISIIIWTVILLAALIYLGSGSVS